MTAGSAVFTLVVNVNPDVAPGTALSNTAVVSSTTTDPHPGNESATATTVVTASANLAVTVTDSPDPVIAGNNLTYTVNFTNTGPSSAQNVSLMEGLLTKLYFVSAW